MKQLENGRYVCKSCGLSWENYGVAASCCAKEATAAQPGEFIEADVAPSVTYADTVPEPLAAELLGRAARHMHDRAATYDKPEGERSMARAIPAFNAITGRDLSESEGWLLMTLLKAVRGFTREQYHADSFEDLIAYGALMAEAKSQGV